MRKTEKAVLFTWVAAVTSISIIGAQLSISQTSNYPSIPVPSPAPATTDILKRIAEAYRSGNVAHARTMAVELKEEPVRKQAIELIRFREAKTALERHDLEMASRLAFELPRGLKRSLVLIGIASQQIADGDKRAGAENLRRAVTVCGELSPHLRVRLLAVAARLSLSTNPQDGEAILRQAVMEYRIAKKRDGSPSTGARNTSLGTTNASFYGTTNASFYEVVRIGSGQSHVFPLHLPGVPDASLSELALDYYSVAGGAL